MRKESTTSGLLGRRMTHGIDPVCDLFEHIEARR